jgi:predicted glycoside hydrolase/deacetylase ChbG (UPF0249 family)
MANEIHLCIMSDDFGMHPAVNEGIVRAFCDGLLTDANIMAPCPAFREAAALARLHNLPVGIHATLTCDWDIYRWGPLTDAPSLRAADGHFPDLVSKTWRTAVYEEARAELLAQMEAMEGENLRSTHASYHMGVDPEGRMLRIFEEIGVERTGPLRIERDTANATLPASRWQSAFCTSTWSVNYKWRKGRLLGRLRRLEPGYHLWMVHAGLDHPDLDTLCSPTFPAWNWARPYRSLDFALLMDPEVKDLIAARGIQRISVTQAPVS